MAIPQSLKTAFEKSDFDAIESAWIEHAEDAPDDVDFFAGTARALTGQGQEELARMLLHLLDDELADTGKWSQRMNLLRATGKLFHRPKTLYDAVIDSLRAIHAKHGRLDELIKVAGLHRLVDRENDLWRRVDGLQSLTGFDAGAVVTMEGHGVGKILDVNTDLESFRVEFPGAAPMNVGFRAAAKLLTTIPADSLAHKLVVDPDSIDEVLSDQPHLLLQEVFARRDRAMSGPEIKKALLGVLPEARWAKWWAAARKHPQVIADSKKRNAYRWVDSNEEATDALTNRFNVADLTGKLRVLAEVQDRPELLAWVADQLRTLVLDNPVTNPAEVATAWVHLKRASSKLVSDLPPSHLLDCSADRLAEIFDGVANATDRLGLYDLLASQRDDWQQVVSLRLAREPEPRLVGALINHLDQEDRAKTILDAIRRASRSPAAFVWVAESARENDAIRSLQPALLMKKLIGARSLDAFEEFRTRLAVLFESGGTVPRLLAELSEEQAADVHKSVKDSRLSSAERLGLMATLETKFPSLREEASRGLYALRSSIDQRREQLRVIKEEELPTNRKAVEEAAALGDLRENFEYKSARQRQEYLSGMAAKLEAELASVRPLDLSQASSDEVRIGSTVTLSGDPEIQYAILGPWESEPEHGVISYQSALGGKLLGMAVGSRIMAGDQEREVLAVGLYSETT